ncbi:hypothetical protein YC2023_024569 [Brassica napus]
MEFYDEDRPRFVFRSRPSSSRTAEENDPKPPNKIFISRTFLKILECRTRIDTTVASKIYL